MTHFDYAVLFVMLLSLLLGVWRGVVSEVLALAAWVTAFFAAQYFAVDAGELLDFALTKSLWRHFAGFLLVFVLVLVLFAFARRLMSKLLHLIGLRPLDRTLGALFGITRGLLVVWLAVLAAGFTQLPEKPWWREAVLAPPFETAVLAAKPWLPPELSDRIKYR